MKLGGPLFLLAIVFGLVALSAQTPLSDTLDIYWIDVEGGAATLVVTPRQESVLMDAGWGRPDDRDARRIEAAMRDANIDRIDYFIASHFHGDHTGGLPALAERVEIGQFLDYGETVEPDSDNSSQAFAAYLRAAEGNRRTVSPGDRLRLDGVVFTFVTAGGEIPSRASSVAGPNVFCDDADPGPSDGGENSQSVGYLLSLGGFQFLNLGDLTVNVQHQLACPENVIGDVDIYQVPHHGTGVAPQLTWALGYNVAVLNNGPHKGGSAEGYHVAAQSPGIQDVWQVHRALDTELADNTAEDLIANVTDEDDCQGYWLKAMVHPDGRSYYVVNGRNGSSRSYFSR